MDFEDDSWLLMVLNSINQILIDEFLWQKVYSVGHEIIGAIVGQDWISSSRGKTKSYFPYMKTILMEDGSLIAS